MNTIKRIKNFISILMIYAADLIVRDRLPADFQYNSPRFDRIITGRVLPRLTTEQE